MSRYQFSPAAISDLEHIDDQTILRFGVRQAMTLAETFEQTFTMLAENPGVGHLREDLSPEGKAFRYWTVLTRFVVVYEPGDGVIRVVRILDGSQDMRAILDRK
ncbi:MAG: type II toxin-antitoxin system RelE/ParE family toxin [Planctomycetota bacterium]